MKPLARAPDISTLDLDFSNCEKPGGHVEIVGKGPRGGRVRLLYSIISGEAAHARFSSVSDSTRWSIAHVRRCETVAVLDLVDATEKRRGLGRAAMTHFLSHLGWCHPSLRYVIFLATPLDDNMTSEALCAFYERFGARRHSKTLSGTVMTIDLEETRSS